MATIALAGNPNAGKSTLFNALTGSQQHVGNWPGKTVEKKEGHLRLDHTQVTIVDLPGTYSLNAYSAEEIIARDFIIDQHPEAVLVVVDAANLERNFYLVMQLLEIGTPMILALNMSDIAENRGIHIDTATLSAKLGGVPIIRTIGARQQGVMEIRQALTQLLQIQPASHATFSLPLPPEMETEIAALMPQIEAEPTLTQRYCQRWLAVKLLEGDEDLKQKLAAYPALLTNAQAAATRIENATDDEPDTLVAEARYDLIAAWMADIVQRSDTDTLTLSDKLDKFLTHRVWGLPIFFALMWLVFQITANVSAPMLDWIDGVLTGPITHWATALLSTLALEDTWFGAFVLEGVIAGVGGVLVFVPVLISLYLSLAILEDSGYMSRAAFVMDRVMHVLGLHGKSFLPLMVGFGCNVPAVYATRTLENELDRKITGFLTTFMSCGARLPVYVIFGAVFFAGSGTFIFAMYLIGIGVAVLTSFLLTRVIFKDKPQTPFVIELPPYRMPNMHTVWRSTWQRTISFIQNAGTVILVASVGIWLLMAIPTKSGERFNDVAPEDSVFGTVSEGVAPIFEPAGFGTWQATGSLITGFVAKEVVVASMSQIYIGEPESEPAPTPSFGEDVTSILTSFADAMILTVQEVINIVPRTVNLIPGINMPEADFLGSAENDAVDGNLENALSNAFTPLSALAFNIFVLLYVPCAATVGAMRHEFGTRWTLAQITYTLFVAWIGAVLVYQVGSLLGV